MALNIRVHRHHRSPGCGLGADAAALPELGELADALTVASDDWRAPTRPHGDETDAAPAKGQLRETGCRPVSGHGATVRDTVTGPIGLAASTAVRRHRACPV
jgi:hypothetical protein